MAIYNEILVGRFARGIQKLFGIKGTTPTKQLSGEVMPVFNLDDANQLENRILHSWSSFGYVKNVAAGGAGTFAAVRLRNPTGSNTIVVVEKITYGSGAASDTYVLRRGPTGTPDLATVDSANNSIRDLRLGPISGSVITSFGTPAGSTGTQVASGTLGANTSVDIILNPHQEIVIAPGDLISVQTPVANQGITVTFFWRERALEVSELVA